MKRLLALLLLLSLVVMPVWGELAAPEVPEAGAKYMPKETKSFGKSLRHILGELLPVLWPNVQEGLKAAASMPSPLAPKTAAQTR